MSARTAPAPVRRTIWILTFALFAGVVLVALALRRGVLTEFERRVAALKASGQPTVPPDLPSAKPLAAEPRLDPPNEPGGPGGRLIMSR